MGDLEGKLLDAHNDNRLFGFIYEIFHEDWSGEKSIPSLLTKLHNNGEVDIITELKSYRNNPSNNDLFCVRSIFEEMLPSLEAPLIEVANCVKHLSIEAGNDMSYMIVPAFKEFCKKNDNRVKELYELAIGSLDEDFDHLSTAIEAGVSFNEDSYVKKAISLLKHESNIVQDRSIYALGRIKYKNTSWIEKTIFAINDSLKLGYSDSKLATSMNAIFHISNQSDNNHKLFLNFLNTYKNQNGDQFIHTAADLLFREKESITIDIESILLDVCTHVNPNNPNTISYIDYVLERLLKQEKFDICAEVLEKLFENSDYNIPVESFDSFIRELKNHPNTFLSKLITRWFLSSKVMLGKFCIKLLTEYSNNEEILSADLQQIPDDLELPYLFLARKACGWFYHRPISAISYMLSLLNNANAEETQEIANLIFDPLLIGYPGKAKDYLAEISGEGSSTASHILSRFEDFHSKLNRTKVIKELDIPTSQKEAYYRKQSEEMAKSYEEAQKGSIMNILGVKHSVLLYGEGSIYYMYREPGQEPIRQETQMSPISTTVEFPAMLTVNPHGLEKMLQHFRLEGCTS